MYIVKKLTHHYLVMLFANTCFCLPALVHAANPSATTVSVTIPAIVQISGLSDITLTPTNFSVPVTGSATACIYTNVINPLGSYYITATSSNAISGTFRAINGANYLSFNAFWNSTSSPTQATPLTSGIKSTQQTGGNGSSLTCSGTPNANFNISISNIQLAGVSAATYTDTVTLLVSPS